MRYKRTDLLSPDGLSGKQLHALMYFCYANILHLVEPCIIEWPLVKCWKDTIRKLVKFYKDNSELLNAQKFAVCWLQELLQQIDMCCTSY
jgi:hypothetical protein